MSDPEKSSAPLIVLAIVVVVVLGVVVAIPLSVIGKGSAPVASSVAISSRIEPVARFELTVAPQAAAGPRTAASIYAATCIACHGTGVNGAPKKGDKAAWGPRLASGIDALVKSAIAGKNAMPPRGGVPDLSEAEIKAVIALMTE